MTPRPEATRLSRSEVGVPVGDQVGRQSEVRQAD